MVKVTYQLEQEINSNARGKLTIDEQPATRETDAWNRTVLGHGGVSGVENQWVAEGPGRESEDRAYAVIRRWRALCVRRNGQELKTVAVCTHIQLSLIHI